MSIYTERLTDNYYNSVSIAGGKKAEKIRKDPTKHYPNKNEAKLLRKIMSETGLTEDEVRSEKHYRVLLSAAQKVGETGKKNDVKIYREFIKEACKKTGLVPQHPETIRALTLILEDHKAALSCWRSPYFVSKIKSAEDVVREYAKK